MTEETQHHKTGLDKNTVYAGFGVLAIILILSTRYSFTQYDALNAKISELGTKLDASQKNYADATARLDKIEGRVAETDVSLKLFYDSNCAFCDNYELLKMIPGLTTELKEEGIKLEAIDLNGNYEQVKELGILRIPAFYATVSSIERSKSLSKFLDYLETNANFQFLQARDGIAEIVPKKTIYTGEACSEKESVLLQEFYSESCRYCKRLYHANGTNTNPIEAFPIVVSESMQEIEKEFGDALKIEKECIPLNGFDEVQYFLGVNKTDTELCKDAVGNQSFDNAIFLANKYAIGTAPMFVADCKYVFNAVSKEDIKQFICGARPDVCRNLKTNTNATTTTASPTPTSSPTATSSPSPSATPSPTATPSVTPTPTASPT